MEHDKELDIMMEMCAKELSEPYSIYTYRFFTDNWPNLTFLVKIILIIIYSKDIL